jgi:hypothetical protein
LRILKCSGQLARSSRNGVSRTPNAASRVARLS